MARVLHYTMCRSYYSVRHRLWEETIRYLPVLCYLIYVCPDSNQEGNVEEDFNVVDEVGEFSRLSMCFMEQGFFGVFFFEFNGATEKKHPKKIGLCGLFVKYSFSSIII